MENKENPVDKKPKEIPCSNGNNPIACVTFSVGCVPIHHTREDGTIVDNYGGEIYQHADGSWHNTPEDWLEIYK